MRNVLSVKHHNIKSNFLFVTWNPSWKSCIFILSYSTHTHICTVQVNARSYFQVSKRESFDFFHKRWILFGLFGHVDKQTMISCNIQIRYPRTRQCERFSVYLPCRVLGYCMVALPFHFVVLARPRSTAWRRPDTKTRSALPADSPNNSSVIRNFGILDVARSNKLFTAARMT